MRVRIVHFLVYLQFKGSMMEERDNTTEFESIDSSNNTALLPLENLIHVIRGQQIMIDSDLAALYGVETRALNQAVKRNAERFPEDFMFRLTKEEAKSVMSQISLKSQNVTVL